ncbi:MAG: hypothetical protein ACREP8_09125 [Candidatus Binatia bacterium]
MIDVSSKGKRCRAVREIRNYAGNVSSSTEGTIEYEITVLGRRLINVRWDNGIYMNVFPHEVEAS